MDERRKERHRSTKQTSWQMQSESRKDRRKTWLTEEILRKRVKAGQKRRKTCRAEADEMRRDRTRKERVAWLRSAGKRARRNEEHQPLRSGVMNRKLRKKKRKTRGGLKWRAHVRKQADKSTVKARECACEKAKKTSGRERKNTRLAMHVKP